MLKAWKTQEEICIGNAIEYDAKLYQVKMTIVKRTNVQLKGLQFNCSQKWCWYGQWVGDAIKKLKYEAST